MISEKSRLRTEKYTLRAPLQPSLQQKAGVTDPTAFSLCPAPAVGATTLQHATTRCSATALQHATAYSTLHSPSGFNLGSTQTPKPVVRRHVVRQSTEKTVFRHDVCSPVSPSSWVSCGIESVSSGGAERILRLGRATSNKSRRQKCASLFDHSTIIQCQAASHCSSPSASRPRCASRRR